METEYPKKYWLLILVVVPILGAILPSISTWILHKNGIPPNNHEYQESIKVSAKGIGYPPKEIANPGQRRILAERAAETVALRNLAEKIKGTIVESSTTTEKQIVSEDKIQLRVQTVIKSAKIINSIDLPDGSVEVIMEAALNER